METIVERSETAKRIVCVSTITRNRPLMLQALLASYAAMEVADDIELRFLIVENNNRPTLQSVIDEFRALVGNKPVQYEMELQLGIAFARNRALECAIDAGADYLTFADDDEIVDRHWLTSLLMERNLSDLDIVGSPVRFAPIPEASTWQRLVWNGLNSRTQKSEKKAAWRKKQGKADRILIATGSWLGRVEFFRTTGLRFDNSLGLSGGEDWRLYRRAREMGAKTGWSSHAIAYETVPVERLNLVYHYRRSRDDSMVIIRERLRNRRAKTIFRLPGSVAGRLLKLSAYVIAIPFTRGASMVFAAACMGNIIGIFQAFTGKRSAHYETTTGA